MAPPVPPTATLRALARGFLDVARTSDVARLAAELELEGQRVEVIIERTFRTVGETDPEDVVDQELVTVKVGTKSRPRTVVAAPAEWIDAT